MEREQLEDRRSVGESCCNYLDGTDQRVQSLMMMMTMMKVSMQIYYEHTHKFCINYKFQNIPTV